MNTRFEILFRLDVAHSYYSAGAADFEFLASAESRILLRNRRLLAKVRDGVLYVLFETDDAGAALIDGSGETIRIGLKLLNPHFFNFTALPFAPRSAIALYRNRTTAGQLDGLQQIALSGSFLNHTLTNAARPATVKLLGSSGPAIFEETVTAENDRSQVTFDLSRSPAGSFSVEETFPGNVQTSTAYYHDAELLQEGVFGIVEIRIDSAFYNSAPVFTIPFTAVQERLKYYVVTHTYSNTDLTQLNISDLGFVEESRPEIVFDKVAAADFAPADLPPSLFGNGDSKVVLFQSQAAVARSDTARRKIQLNRNGKVLIVHMPQPGASQTTADMIIHVSKP